MIYPNERISLASHPNAMRDCVWKPDMWKDHLSCNAKGDELYNKGNYEEALKCYEKAIKLSPEPNDFYYYNKGASLNFLGMYQEAVMAYDEAIKLS